ncbi:MAG TPA: Nramp family divalent metal transporter [Vicinamibacterales bacterium]|nr:Nramp family divalent metal transporter [Vicinamibacterales bacterium]
MTVVSSRPAAQDPPIPRSLAEYVRSFGPGIVIVLTWLGAGDVVDMGTAGANYGYALLWVFVVAVLFRFVFVSLVARYHLCNQHGHGVLDGLVRLHPAYAPLLFVAAVVMGHVYGSYMTRGAGEVCRAVFGFGEIWQWAIASNASALYLVFRPGFRALERVFFFFLAVMSASFLGSALWVGFDPGEVVHGLIRVEMPGRHGAYDPWRVALAMVGAVGGSLMNLVYPYFLDAKGWRGPRYRRVQLYDLLVGIAAMLVLNLAVWALGAELLYPDRHIEHLEDLPNLLSALLGDSGRLLFYAGIFSAVYTSIIGHAVGLGCLGTHAWLRWSEPVGAIPPEFRRHRCYRWIASWCLVSPLVWSLPGMPGFVPLTLAANTAQVVLLPLLAGGLWWITASERLIGREHRNRWWENVVMAALFVLAVYFALQAAGSLAARL